MQFPLWIKRLFKRQAKTILEQLEAIENDILDLESTKTSSIDTEKRFVFRLLLYSFILFGMIFIFVYYYCWPSTQFGKAVLWTSFLVYPSIVSGLKWGFHAYFLRSISRADERLKSLREEKQRLLEEVMENETFNKAQQILKRFDPLMFARLSALERDVTQTPKTTRKTPRPTSEWKSTHRVPNGDSRMTPAPHSALQTKDHDADNTDSRTPIVRMANAAQPRLPRPILPRERTVLDRILDALVGDGPDKRFALICTECAGHNGMALKEEFEYLAFRCCYCSYFNPPRRRRLKAPIPANVAHPIGSTAPGDAYTTPGRASSMFELRDHSLSCDTPPSVTPPSDIQAEIDPAADQTVTASETT